MHGCSVTAAHIRARDPAPGRRGASIHPTRRGRTRATHPRRARMLCPIPAREHPPSCYHHASPRSLPNTSAYLHWGRHAKPGDRPTG